MERLSSGGHDVHAGYTQGPKDATRLAAAACAAGAKMICVAGGDGTIHEAVEGMIDSGIPLLPIPCGTENVIAKFLGIRLDGDRLLEAFSSWANREFRVMEANGRNVLFACGLGLDGYVIRELAARRKGHISYWTYVRPVLGALFGYRSATAAITVDGSEVYRGPGLVLIGKVPRYALGLKALWQADPADEWIDVAVFPRRWALPLAWDAVRLLVNPRWRSASAFYAKGKSVRLTSDSPMPMQMDGEYAGETPLDVRLSGKVVNFVAAPALRGR